MAMPADVLSRSATTDTAIRNSLFRSRRGAASRLGRRRPPSDGRRGGADKDGRHDRESRRVAERAHAGREQEHQQERRDIGTLRQHWHTSSRNCAGRWGGLPWFRRMLVLSLRFQTLKIAERGNSIPPSCNSAMPSGLRRPPEADSLWWSGETPRIDRSAVPQPAPRARKEPAAWARQSGAPTRSIDTHRSRF